MRPDNLTGRLDRPAGLREIKTQVKLAIGLQWRIALDRDTVFTYIHDPIEVKHRSLGLSGEAGIRRSTYLVSHTTTAIRRGRRQRCAHDSHGEDRSQSLMPT